MSTVLKQDTNGVKPLLGVGELGYDNYPAGGDAGRLYVGTGSDNIALAKKQEVDGLTNDTVLTGTPTAPTAAVGTNSTQLATTAFVQAEIANDAPTKTGGGASGTWGINISGSSASTTGNAATATKLATARTINGVAFDGTANITIADGTKAPLASPALTGTPTAPTAIVGTNTTQLATTAFVNAEIANDAVAKDSNTGAALLPSGTTAQRPTAGAAKLRFNTELAKFEGHNGSAWGSLGGATGGGNDAVFYVNGQTVTANYTIPTGQNAMSAGPVTINDGVTVTVSDGSNWSIV